MTNPFQIITEQSTETTPIVVTVLQKMLMTDLFISTNADVTKTKHKMGKLRLPSSQIKQSFAKKRAILNYVIQLMKGTVIIEAEERNEESNEITKEAIYNSIPKTIEDLKAQAYLNFPNCSKEAFDYNIEQIVKWSDGTGKNSFENFKYI